MARHLQDLSEEKRLHEVSLLLARGFLRYQQKQLDMAGDSSVYGGQQNV